MTDAAASDPIAAVSASAAGLRLLAVLREPWAETRRRGRRGPTMAGAIEGVALTGDALPDLLDRREPLRFELTWPGEVAALAQELRARLHGDVVRRAWHDVVELRSADSTPLVVRVRPGGAAADGPWSDPVLTARAARLGLDGRLDDPGGDLAARRVRLVDPDGLTRRPEALLHLARLGSRPGWTIAAETLAAAQEARLVGAPASAPVAHAGAALADLLAAPEAVAALELLQRLAPDVALADGVEVDGERLRSALDAPPAERLDAVLHALAPSAGERRIRDFRTGARLREAGASASGPSAR